MKNNLSTLNHTSPDGVRLVTKKIERIAYMCNNCYYECKHVDDDKNCQIQFNIPECLGILNKISNVIFIPESEIINE